MNERFLAQLAEFLYKLVKMLSMCVSVPRPHDSRGLGLIQLGLVASVVFEVLLKCFVTLTLKIWHFLFSV